MKRIFSPVLWILLFLAALLGMDQLLLRFPAESPALVDIQDVYRDFRARLGRLPGEKKPATLESVIEQAEKKKAIPGGGSSPQASPRYLYVDGEGQLQFADTLEQIPPPYRKEAQSLGQ